MIKTLRFRIKDKSKPWLNELAKEVNFVWNYVNDLSFKMIKNRGRFLSAYDMHKYLAGATKAGLSLHSHSVQEVAEQYCIRRKQFKKRKLRWRCSRGSKRSLGWIPFKARSVRVKNGFLMYGKYCFKIWDSYGIDKYEFRSGSFSEDSRGNWFFNVCVEAEPRPSSGTGEVGIDLGLKDFATCSDGTKVDAQQFYRRQEHELAVAQRANKKTRSKAIHQKIKNKRKDFLHNLSTNLIAENRVVVVGNVNSSGLAKTGMAKSVLDAGWSMFRTMLEYKAVARQVVFLVVNESFTTVTCSACKERTGPKGLVGLRIREWECSACGFSHDRDTNAAQNILRLGHETLAVGIQ